MRLQLSASAHGRALGQETLTRNGRPRPQISSSGHPKPPFATRVARFLSVLDSSVFHRKALPRDLHRSIPMRVGRDLESFCERRIARGCEMTIKLSVNMIQTASSPRVPFRGLNPAMEGLARMRVLLFVLVVAAPCFSQSTWSGLRFGMTPAEVRLALKDRPNKSRTEPVHPDLQMPELFFIDVPNVTVGEHKGTAHLGFDRDHSCPKQQLPERMHRLAVS